MHALTILSCRDGLLQAHPPIVGVVARIGVKVETLSAGADDLAADGMQPSGLRRRYERDVLMPRQLARKTFRSLGRCLREDLQQIQRDWPPLDGEPLAPVTLDAWRFGYDEEVVEQEKVGRSPRASTVPEVNRPFLLEAGGARDVEILQEAVSVSPDRWYIKSRSTVVTHEFGIILEAQSLSQIPHRHCALRFANAEVSLRALLAEHVDGPQQLGSTGVGW